MFLIILLFNSHFLLFSADIFTDTQSGNVTEVMQAIEAGADINTRTYIKQLLSEKDITIANNYGHTKNWLSKMKHRRYKTP